MNEAPVFYRADTYTLESSLGFLVNRLGQLLGRELDRRMVDLGLTDAQWKPMLLLQQGACTTAGDIARMANLDTGAVTRLLNRLEDKGFICRRRSPQDRRVIHLELSAAGRRAADQVPEIISDLANQLLQGFSAEEFACFKDYLDRATHNLRSLSDAVPEAR